MATVLQGISGLYITAYNRAADNVGQAFWANQLGLTVAQAATATITDAQMATLATQFVNTQSTYFNATYAALDNVSYIQKLYNNLGGNNGDAAGVLFWVTKLTSGETRTQVLGEFVAAFINIDLSVKPANLSQFDYDQAVIRQHAFLNKILVSFDFAAQTDPLFIPHNTTDAAFQASVRAIQGVTANDATRDNALNQIDAAAAAHNLALITGQNDLNFTTALNETLVANASVPAVFHANIDTVIVGNNTLNFGDKAVGSNLLGDVEWLIVNENNGLVIQPVSTGVEEFRVTDLSDTHYDMQFFSPVDINLIHSLGSLEDQMFFFNIQRRVDIAITNNDSPTEAFYQFTVINSVANGAITLTLADAGDVEIEYCHTNGTSVVTALNIASTGTSDIEWDCAGALTSITPTGSGHLTIDLDNAELENGGDGMPNLTVVDAHGFAGEFGIFGLEIQDHLTFTSSSTGANSIEAEMFDDTSIVVNALTNFDHEVVIRGDDENGADNVTVDINLGNGDNFVEVFNLDDGAVVTVDATNGDNVVDVEAGNDADVEVTLGNGDNEVAVTVLDPSTVDIQVGSGDNEISASFGNGADVEISTGSGDNDINMLVTTNDVENAGGQTVDVDVGSGNDTVNIDIEGAVFNGGEDALFGDDGFTGDGDFVPGDDLVGFAGVPDSVVARNMLITVALGAGDNVSFIHTGSDSDVEVTAGSGDDDITIQAENGIFAAPLTFLGSGASTVDVNAGNGDNIVSVNTISASPLIGPNADVGSQITIVTGTGDDEITTVSGNDANVNIDAGDGNNDVEVTVGDPSVVVVVTGDGNDTVDVTMPGGANNTVTITTNDGNDVVTVDSAIGNTVTVHLGAGDDTLAIDSLAAGIVVDGGPGSLDLLQTTSNAAGVGNVTGSVSGFEILEITDLLVNSINLVQDFNGEISHVILDEGSSGSHSITGFLPTAQLDILGANNGPTNLTVSLANAVFNTNDNLHLLLADDLNSGVSDFGALTFAFIEELTIQSTSRFGDETPQDNVNQIHINDIFPFTLDTITIEHHAADDGDVFLDFASGGDDGVIFTGNDIVGDDFFTGADADALAVIGDDFFVSVSTIEATGFTAGFDVVDRINDSVTINAPDTTQDSNIRINSFSGSFADTVTLGDGDNRVWTREGVVGEAGDTITAGNGDNNVVTGGGNDVITLGTGNNQVDAGGGQDDITFASHTDGGDLVLFRAATDSGFSVPDKITGFDQAGTGSDNDVLAFANGILDNNSIVYAEAGSDIGVLAVLAAAFGTTTDAIAILNTSTGHLFIDVNSDGAFVFGTDMEINLVGVTHLDGDNFFISGTFGTFP